METLLLDSNKDGQQIAGVATARSTTRNIPLRTSKYTNGKENRCG